MKRFKYHCNRKSLHIGRSYRLSRLLPPFEEVAAAIPELEVDLRGGAEDDLDDDVGGVAKKEI